MKYFVVVALDTDYLEKEVERLLQQGWRCQGGVSMVEYRTGGDLQFTRYAQAMIREA